MPLMDTRSGRLLGRQILVTRPAAQAAPLAAMIAAEGGSSLCFPLLEIGPVDDLAAVHAAAACLSSWAFVVFISPNAVDYGLAPLLAGRPWPATACAVAIGQSTAALLREKGLSRVVAPTARFDSEALLELPPFQLAQVAGKRVLILRGNGGRELLAETLRERGAEVVCATCYQRSAPQDVSALSSALQRDELDALTVSSSEGLRNLWAMLSDEARCRVQRLPLFVPHARIAEQAEAFGMQRIVLTEPADAGIIEGLKTFDWQGA